MQSETATEQFSVSNVKCEGCVTTIREGLTALDNIEAVEVDVSSGSVQVTGQGLSRTTLANKLAELGYPETS